MIRIATEADANDIYRMCLSFKQASPYADLPEEEGSIRDFISRLLRDPKDKSICLVYGDPIRGLLAGTTAMFMWNTQLHASELVWWVDPGHRGVGHELKSAFEYWAKNVAGCSHVHMAALDDRVGKLYTKDGYKKTEISYLKEL